MKKVGVRSCLLSAVQEREGICAREQLLDRKSELRRLLAHVRKDEPLMYADHVEQHGEASLLFQRACKLDLEGIVAKLNSGPYVSERENSTWRKILNPNYSQREGRG